MTVDDHGVNDGEHDGVMAEEVMEVGTGRRGLDRRRLLGGVVVGAAGLLLPGQSARAQVEGLFNLKPFRWEIHYQQVDMIRIFAYRSTYFGDPPQWIEFYYSSLIQGGKAVIEYPPPPDGYQPVSRVEFRGSEHTHTLESINPVVGTPRITIDGKTQAPEVGQSFVWTFSAREGEIEVTRRADTKFKEYLVEFKKPDNQQRTKDNKDNKDNKDKNDNNDNNKRQRKRRGGSGGRGDTDRRKRPVDRLLD